LQQDAADGHVYVLLCAYHNLPIANCRLMYSSSETCVFIKTRMYMVDQRKLSITRHQIRDILEKKFY